MAIEIVGFTHEHGDFHSYVKLPEGTWGTKRCRRFWMDLMCLLWGAWGDRLVCFSDILLRLGKGLMDLIWNEAHKAWGPGSCITESFVPQPAWVDVTSVYTSRLHSPLGYASVLSATSAVLASIGSGKRGEGRELDFHRSVLLRFAKWPGPFSDGFIIIYHHLSSRKPSNYRAILHTFCHS